MRLQHEIERRLKQDCHHNVLGVEPRSCQQRTAEDPKSDWASAERLPPQHLSLSGASFGDNGEEGFSGCARSDLHLRPTRPACICH